MLVPADPSRRHPQPQRAGLVLHALVLAACLAGCAVRDAQPEQYWPPRTYERVLDTIRRAGEIPGVSAALLRDGELVYAGGVGLADRERGMPATRETVYPIGSITKLLTAGALVHLDSRGILDLDDPVTSWVPEFGDDRVTLRMLAGHLGGIRHYGPAEYRNPQPVDRIETTLDRFVNDPLESEPGTRYRYSSYGYVLLGVAMERASGRAFPELIEETVTGPGGLAIYPESRPGAHRAAGYDSLEGEIVRSPAHFNSDRWPAGGYVAGTLALTAFGLLAVDGLFGEEPENELFRPQTLLDGESTGVGLGWRIADDALGRTQYHHAGSTYGGRAVLVVYPDEKLAVALAGNLGRAPFARPDAEFLADIARCKGGMPPGRRWAGDYDLSIRRRDKEPIEATLELDTAGGGLVRIKEEDLPVGWAGACGEWLLVAAVGGGSGTELFWLREDEGGLSGHTWRGDDDLTAIRRESG